MTAIYFAYSSASNPRVSTDLYAGEMHHLPSQPHDQLKFIQQQVDCQVYTLLAVVLLFT